MFIHIVNGPNLNLTGKREPEQYGTESFESYLERLRTLHPVCHIEYFQSNSEGELIDYLQKHGFEDCYIILNAGAYSHTSLALADTIRAINSDVIEVHISNIYAREEYRRKSLISEACVGVISGLGLLGYELAIRYYSRCRD
jgi:3-dehydroquinate dehydratase-2